MERVLIEDHRAVGVRVRIDDEWLGLEGGEVLLCAGAVHSPAVLLRSGIGPSSGLPVGEGLQDHANAFLFIDYRDGHGPETIDDRHTNCCLRYTSGLDGTGENDMMMVTMNHSARPAPGGLLVAWVNQAFSRGKLRLASDDPDEHPIIDENMLADPRDLERLRDATRRMIDLTRQPPFDDIAADIAIDARGTAVASLDTDRAIDEWLLATASDAQHICATAAMGRVVDHQCRVLGHEGLRVIDASVVPDVPRANTHLMTLALADEMAHRLTR